MRQLIKRLSKLESGAGGSVVVLAEWDEESDAAIARCDHLAGRQPIIVRFRGLSYPHDQGGRDGR